MDEEPLHASCHFNHDPFENTQFACVGHQRDQRILLHPLRHASNRALVLIFFLNPPPLPPPRFILEFSLFERISSSSKKSVSRKKAPISLE